MIERTITPHYPNGELYPAYIDVKVGDSERCYVPESDYTPIRMPETDAMSRTELRMLVEDISAELAEAKREREDCRAKLGAVLDLLHDAERAAHGI